MKKYILPLLLLFLFLSSAAQTQTFKEILYVGTFSVRGSEGIYVYGLDRGKGTFQIVQSIKTLESPSFLAIHPSGKFLYSVNRGMAEGRASAGSVSAFSIDPATGKLTWINDKTSFGSDPCHITIDHTGKLAFIANYNSGNLVAYKLNSDGSIGELGDSIRFTGSSINKARQEKSHLHFSILSPDNRFLLATDLGADKIYSFSVDLASGKLTPAQQPFVEVKAGSGPRHLAFHPNGNHVYVSEELTSTVGVLAYAKENGALTVVQDQVVSLPTDFMGSNTSADIHTDASGKHVLISNRGQNAIAVFSIDEKGSLKLLESESTGGEVPRNFLVDPKSQYVWAANQNTDTIVVFKYSKKGELTRTGAEIKVPAPVCLQLLKLE